MTTPMIAGDHITRGPRACDAARWLGLAAAPTFALTAWISALGAPQAMMASS